MFSITDQNPFWFWLFFSVLAKIIYDVKKILSGDEGQKAKAIRAVDRNRGTNKNPTVLIVGAGAAGLAVGAVLKEKKISFVILDSAIRSGDTWRNRYDRLHLHTTRENSSLPHQSMPKHFNVFPSKTEVADYLDAYAALLGAENIRYQHQVTNAEFDNTSRLWTVTAESMLTNEKINYCVSFLVVATGECVIPKIPTFKNQEKFQGKITHSATYKSGKEFAGKKVLVVGYGNSGGEISMDLWEHDAIPTVLIRSPINIVPRYLSRILEDVFETYFRANLLPFSLTKEIPPIINKFFYSDLKQFGIVTPHPTLNAAENMTEAHVAAVVDIGNIDLIRNRSVKVVSHEISSFTENSVVFKDGTEQEFDCVILCTGYQKIATFSKFLSDKIIKECLNKRGVIGGCTKPEFNLFFNGYNNNTGRFRQMHLDSFVIGDCIESIILNKAK